MSKVDIRFNKKDLSFYCQLESCDTDPSKVLKSLISRTQAKLKQLEKQKVIKYYTVFEYPLKKALNRLHTKKSKVPEYLLVSQAAPELHALSVELRKGELGESIKVLNIYPDSDLMQMPLPWIKEYISRELGHDGFDVMVQQNVLNLILKAVFEKRPLLKIVDCMDPQSEIIVNTEHYEISYHKRFRYYLLERKNNLNIDGQDKEFIYSTIKNHQNQLGTPYSVLKFLDESLFVKHPYAKEYDDLFPKKSTIAFQYSPFAKDDLGSSRDIIFASELYQFLCQNIENTDLMGDFENLQGVVSMDGEKVEKIIHRLKLHHVLESNCRTFDSIYCPVVSRNSPEAPRNFIVSKSIELGLRSMTDIPSKYRSVQGLTFSLSSKQLSTVISKIENLHQSVIPNSIAWTNDAFAMSLNTQLVPLTMMQDSYKQEDDGVHYSDASIKYPQWINTVIREILGLSYYDCNPHWIQQKLIPYVPIEKIKQALIMLEKSNMIEFDQKTRKYYPIKENILTPQEVQGESIKEFHRSMIENAKEIGKKIGYMNCSFVHSKSIASVETILKTKELIVKTIEDILVEDQEFGCGDALFQLNVQYYPYLFPKGD